MPKQPDSTTLGAAADAREGLADDERNAALILRLKMRNPARERRLTKDQATLIGVLEKL